MHRPGWCIRSDIQPGSWGWLPSHLPVPVLLISPWAGVVVDRMPRRTLLMMTQSGAMILAFVMAALTFTNVIQEWQVIVLAALLGVVNAFDAPARQAFVSEIVTREDLPNAIAMNSMMFNSARVIGPAVAGLALVAVGAAWCFTINGISFLAVLVSLWLMNLPRAMGHSDGLALESTEKRAALYRKSP